MNQEPPIGESRMFHRPR